MLKKFAMSTISSFTAIDLYNIMSIKHSISLKRTVGRAAFSASLCGILDRLEPTTNAQVAAPSVEPSVAAPSVAAPHQGVAGQMLWQKYLRPGSGSKSSVRHHDVKLMQNYAINRSKLKFRYTLAILHSVLGLRGALA